MKGRRRASAPVRVERAAGVATVVLARPQTGNVLDPEMQQALIEAADDLRIAEDVAVIVLAAEGRDFSRGATLGAVPDWTPWPDVIEAIARLEQPVVGALQGRVEGLGLALALAADILVGASSTRLVAVDPARGRLPGGGLVQRLTRVVGATRATRMLLLGEAVDAGDACRWGLLRRVVAPGRARAVAGALARGLARQAPIALRYAKEACRRALELPLDQGVRLEHDLYVLLQTTADRRAGVEAFRERRSPRFEGC